jgi:MoxR-like ATPase
MPSDVTGTDVIQDDPATGQRRLAFMPGPVFANVLLADEVNRTPPKTQSALLEAMQEKRVTVQGRTYELEPPFFVFATQNPIELEGTYPLPEAQLDRFMLEVLLDYCRRRTRWRREGDHALPPEAVRRWSRATRSSRSSSVVRRVPVADAVTRWAVRWCACAAPGPAGARLRQAVVSYGASVRAAQALCSAPRRGRCCRGVRTWGSTTCGRWRARCCATA